MVKTNYFKVKVTVPSGPQSPPRNRGAFVFYLGHVLRLHHPKPTGWLFLHRTICRSGETIDPTQSWGNPNNFEKKAMETGLFGVLRLPVGGHQTRTLPQETTQSAVLSTTD